MTEETKDVTRGGRARKGVGKPNLTEGKTKRIEPVTGSIHDSELVKITTKDSHNDIMNNEKLKKIGGKILKKTINNTYSPF